MAHFSEQVIQNYAGWDEFYEKDVDEKIKFFSREDRLFDIVFSQQFDRKFLDYICEFRIIVEIVLFVWIVFQII